MNMTDIGVVIREARKTASRSQAAVAGSIGMSRATLSAIENGTVGEIGIRKVMALCATLGLELNAAPKRHRPTLKQVMEERRAGKHGT